MKLRFLTLAAATALAALWLAPVAMAAEDVESLVCAFENSAELGCWTASTSRSLSSQHATQGKKSLEWKLRPDEEALLSSDKLRAIGRIGSQFTDFSGADELALDVFNPTGRLVRITVRLADRTSGIDDLSRSFRKPFTLRPGQNDVRVGLDRLAATAGDRSLNPAEFVLLELSCEKAPSDDSLFIDNLRLVTWGDTPEIARDSGVLRFDFGSRDSARWHGFWRVSEEDSYSKGRGWGWTTPPQGSGAGAPDELAGDFAVCRSASFRCDLPDGRYSLWMIRAPAPSPCNSWSVKAGGKDAFGEAITPEAFYSREHLFRYMDIECTAETDVWREYFGASHPDASVEVQVSGGFIVLDFENVSVSAVMLSPTSMMNAQKAYVAKVSETRKKALFDRFFYQEPLPRSEVSLKPTAVDNGRGYVLFLKDIGDDLYPNALPTDEERSNDVKLSTAMGTPVSAVVGIVPINDGEIRITQGELACGPNRLSPDAVKFYRVRFLPKVKSPGVFTIAASHLDETSSLALKRNRTEFLWLKLSPGDAKPGSYSGTVILTSGTVTSAISISLTIYPFKLPSSMAQSYGVFYRDPWIADANYRFAAFESMKQKALKYLEVELEDMAARGFSALELPCAKVLSVSGDGRSVQMDFSALDEFVKVAESVHFPLKGVVARADSILPAYHLPGELRRLGVTSSQDFTSCYSDALGKLRAWAEKQGLSVVFWVYNPWATAELDQKGLFTESRICLELARRVPGVRTLAVLPSDVLPGGDIEVILPFADVVVSPPYASSKRIWERANAEELQSIWACGEGAGRFACGFQTWRMGASGRWESEYQNWVTPYNPFAGGRGLVLPGRGPVPTIAYERITAGLTDVRYVALLREKIDQAKNDASAQALAKSAENALARMASRAPAFAGASPGGPDFLGALPRQADGWRKEVVDQITSLMTALKEIEPQRAVDTTRAGASQGTQAPGDLMGWLRWRFPGWDPAHLLILAALGVVLLAVLGVVLWRWKKESAVEEDEEEEEEEGEEDAAE